MVRPISGLSQVHNLCLKHTEEGYSFLTVKVPDMCLPTFHTTDAKFSPYFCNRAETDRVHLLRSDRELFLRPHVTPYREHSLNYAPVTAICH